MIPSLGVIAASGLTGPDAAVALMESARSWYSSQTTAAADQEVDNRNDGTADPLVRGSTTGVDANDPVFNDVDKVWELDSTAGLYLNLPTSDRPSFTATTGTYTVMVCFEGANAGGFTRAYSAEPSVSKGLCLQMHYGDCRAYVGGTGGAAYSKLGGVLTSGREVVAGVVDTGQVKSYRHGSGLDSGASITGVGTITYGGPIIGGRADDYTANSFVRDTYEVLIWDGALTETELDLVAAKIKAGGYIV